MVYITNVFKMSFIRLKTLRTRNEFVKSRGYRHDAKSRREQTENLISDVPSAKTISLKNYFTG